MISLNSEFASQFAGHDQRMDEIRRAYGNSVKERTLQQTRSDKKITHLSDAAVANTSTTESVSSKKAISVPS